MIFKENTNYLISWHLTFNHSVMNFSINMKQALNFLT